MAGKSLASSTERANEQTFMLRPPLDLPFLLVIFQRGKVDTFTIFILHFFCPTSCLEKKSVQSLFVKPFRKSGKSVIKISKLAN